MGLDDFNRANAGNLGANWTTVTSSTTFTLASNEARVGTGSVVRYNAESLNDDHWSETTLGSVMDDAPNPGDGGGVGPAWRVAAAAKTFYYVNANASVGHELHYGKFVAGTHTPIAENNTGPTPATGTIVRGGGQGTTQRVYVGGSELFTFTDSSIGTGSQAGMSGDAFNSFGTVNEWQSGNFAAASPPMFRGV